MLAPLSALLVVVVFLVLVAWTRYVSLGSVSAAAASPLAMLLGARLGWLPEGALVPYVLAAAVIGAVIVFKHRANLRRLIAGEESKLGERASVEAEVG